MAEGDPDKPKRVVPRRVCPECGGLGEVRGLYNPQEIYPCPECEGRGSVKWR